MDPNETLARLRELIADRDFPEWADEHGNEVADLFEKLDNWLCERGGFPPVDWDKRVTG